MSAPAVDLAPAGGAELPSAARTDRVVLAAGLALGALAIAGIVAAYPLVENRYAFGWDGGRRTIGDLEAARALRELAPHRFLWFVLVSGAEVWPTLRTLVAAPLLAVVGPSLDAENGITIALYGALFVLLAVAAVRCTRTRGQALLALVLSAGALAGVRPLLNWAAQPYLEVLGAATTLAAAIAWIRLREGRSDAPVWPLALAGNLVYHSKYQYGIFLALAVLATEAATLPREARERALGGLGAAVRAAARRPTAWLWVVASAGSAAAAFAVARWGGEAFSIGGVRLSLTRPHAPITWAAILAFYGVQLELWRGRAFLREAVPGRLRALWVWLFTPMAAWTLLPFTWRLRLLLFTAASYDAEPLGLADRLLYYPRAMALAWWAPPAAAAVALGLVLTAVAAARSAEVRRRLLPVASVIAGQVLLLTVVTRSNFQARFILNLAPLLALAAVLWVPAVGGWARALAGGGMATALAIALASGWGPAPLARALSEGRMVMPADVTARCEAVGAAVSFRDASLVNDLPEPVRQDCSLRVDVAAWRSGARLQHWRERMRLRPEVVHLDEGCGTPSAPLPTGAVLEDRREVAGVCIRRWRTSR